jgi:microsomal dipeptidase-like Zn-dependent dipeptidase
MKFNDHVMALLGIPDLPPRAFIRKAGGGIIPQGGGSGPSSTSTSTTDLPEWAKGYAQETLAKQYALSDVPYQTYDADRIQGLTPMQEQARKDAADIDAGPTGFSANVSKYMSPYQQNVTDIQKREAIRQSDIQGTQQQAQATQSGAFGGSRDAIMRAERERNLGQQMGDIQARGDQANYEQASKQFREGITQGMDVNRLQSAYGAQQQVMGQRGLDLAVQDFQNQKNYPQQQLSNLAGMMRGLPIGSTTNYSGTSSQGSPSFGQMVSGGVTGLFGLKNFFADGGSVDSQQNIESIVRKLSDQQLNQAEQAAKVRGDAEQLQAIQTEKAARASMKNGLASLPVDMDKMLPTEQSMARGGIVAFNGASGSDVSEDDEDGGGADVSAQGPGNSTVYNEALQNQLAQAKAVAQAKYESMKPEDYNRIIDERRASLLRGIGESPYAAMRADAKRLGEESATNLKQSKGLAAIQAAAAMLQGNDLSRGLAAGASTFAGTYGEAVKADQAQKAAIQRMNINIADAERKEKMGLTRDAITAADQARKDHQAAQVYGIEKAKALGKVYEGIAKTSKPGAAAKAPPPLKVAEQAVQSAVKARMAREKPKQGETPEMMQDRITSEESNRVLGMLQQRQVFSMADIGGTSAALRGESQDTTRQTNASNAWDKASSRLKISPEYLNAKPEVRAQMAEDAKIEAYARFGLAPPKVATAAPAAAKAAPAKTVPASQIPAGTTFGKVVPGKGTEVLKDGKVIGYAN